MTNFASSALSFIYIGIIMLLANELPTMLLSLLLLLCLWNLLMASKGLTRPATLITNILAAALLAVLFITVDLKQSVLLFVTMLLQASILKLLQAGNAKQQQTVIVLTFFSISTVFLYQQSLYSTLLVGLFFITLTIALASLNGLPTTRLATRKSIYSLSIAVPLAALMLVFVPKMPAFWQLPGANSAKTGLNERIDPFDIASLAKSDELVFRAEFNDTQAAPPYYWRAMLHTSFDGKAWVKEQGPAQVRQDIDWPAYSGSAQIYLEKSANRWLYTLGDGVSRASEVRNLYDGLLQRKDPSASSFKYPLRYRPQLPATLSRYEYQFYTQLPQQGNPHARRLAKRLGASSKDAEAFASELYGYYRNQGFTYTLTPTPITGSDTLDIFLTQTQRGFCGHYASVSAFMMRSVGIPARVVSGYLGGENVGGSNYLSVYQYDAHAWVEYHDGERWQRFDATSVVAPERLNGSLSQVDQLQQEFRANLELGLLQLSNFESLNWLRIQLEKIDYTWTKWVLGFDQEKQNNLLKGLLGSQFAQYSMALVVIVIALVLFIVLMLSSRQRKVQLSFGATQLAKLFNAADASALLSPQQLTPVAQLAYLATHTPKLKAQMEQISRLYVQATYKQKPLTNKQRLELKKLVNQSIKIIG
ncbi:DUF3488 and transglutaminase-like domain-containing protein [Pseudoalteromonas sp. BDTF-M6]|uniref:transglutaminase family protein n=1 Tax=Pseudoalteromonas sp. BDTF-M6 TaxID=2796132 RepID=UPI001BB0C852|nr:DUF3488 and transglutaminase-like domain-containing protein [Pseudoalteromonas sp. BDTF-M6]MBS3796715.1 DUF3488 domain-containing protein [Pseudoalteromonas sp. BDTF-M6]